MLKPHRVVMDRVSSYADEAAAFVRRRRHERREYARIGYPGGEAVELEPGSGPARRLGEVAAELVELAGTSAEKQSRRRS